MSLETVHKLNVRQLQSAKLAGLTFAKWATVTVGTTIRAIDYRRIAIAKPTSYLPYVDPMSTYGS